MTIFIRIEYLNTKARLEILEDAEGTSTDTDLLQEIEEVAVMPSPQPSISSEGIAEYCNPVAIILATCALVTSIGRVLRPSKVK